jgi:hypothetical protein
MFLTLIKLDMLQRFSPGEREGLVMVRSRELVEGLDVAQQRSRQAVELHDQLVQLSAPRASL